PLELKRRIGSLDAGRIAAMDPATLEEAFRRRPALHRFPGSMARRTQELCAALVRDYGGDPSRVWNEARDGRDLKARLLGLPGPGSAPVRRGRPSVAESRVPGPRSRRRRPRRPVAAAAAPARGLAPAGRGAGRPPRGAPAVA